MQNMTGQPPTLDDLRTRRHEILAVAEEYGADNVRVFGSVARGEATPESDVDLLVNLPRPYTLLKLSGLVRSLSELLGYSVNVTSAEHLREDMRDSVLRDAKVL